MSRPFIRFVLATTLAVAMPFAVSFAGAIHLEWDAVAGATGYRAYFGTSPGQYTGVQDMGSSKSGMVTGLADCTTYYLAIKGYDERGGISSQFSNEVTGWARPEITGMTPTSVVQGDQLTLDVEGANFDSAARVTPIIEGVPKDIDGKNLIVVDDMTVVSCNQLQALITIEPSARGLRAMEIGGFNIDFEVVNPDTVFVNGTETVLVELDESRADINRDDADTQDRVDGKDLAWLAHVFGSSQGDPSFSPDADLDGNGLVGGDDLTLLSVRFGQCWTGSFWSDNACN